MALKRSCTSNYPPLWSITMAVIGVFCIVFIAEDAFSWGVPGKAASGSGQGPGGGARSGSAPAPFGFIFLCFGTGLASLYYNKIRSHFVPFAAPLLVLVAGYLFDDTSALYAFLLSVPILACGLMSNIKDDQRKRRSYLMMGCLIACIASPITQVLTPYFMIFAVFFVISQTSMPHVSKFLFYFCGILTLLTLQPYALFIDDMLQIVATTMTTTMLLISGFAVEQHGTVIVGLETTLRITKACVGAEVLATTSVLCGFLSALFIPASRQLIFFIQLSCVTFVLNILRLLTVALLSHYLLDIEFAQLHMHTGWVVALITYSVMAAMTLRSRADTPNDAGSFS